MYWFQTPPLNPALNMAIDEALFTSDKTVARFYEWKCPALSIGYFQKAADLRTSLPFVRRITGGGVVEHGEDLTFSLVLDLSLSPELNPIRQSYFLIHQGILEALRGLGIKAELYSALDEHSGNYCFQSPAPGDIMFERSKLVGGAQRRRGPILLHQGSMSLNALEVNRDQVMCAMLEGVSKIFQLDLEEGFDILPLAQMTETLEDKYNSRDWSYKY